MIEKKNKRLMIRITELEDNILKLISNGNPKTQDNKTNNIHFLFNYGLVFFINLNIIKSIEDFKKRIEGIKKDGFILNAYDRELKKFYNLNKLKGGAT